MPCYLHPVRRHLLECPANEGSEFCTNYSLGTGRGLTSAQVGLDLEATNVRIANSFAGQYTLLGIRY